jgi:hypothetical protein
LTSKAFEVRKEHLYIRDTKKQKLDKQLETQERHEKEKTNEAILSQMQAIANLILTLTTQMERTNDENDRNQLELEIAEYTHLRRQLGKKINMETFNIN